MDIFRFNRFTKQFHLAILLALMVVLNHLSSPLHSQTLPENIDFKVHCLKGKTNLNGAIVTVFKNTYTKFDEKTTGLTGRVSFNLPFGYDYKVIFKYPGCVEMYLEVKGSTIPRDRTDAYPSYQAEAQFFETADVSVNADLFLRSPFTKVIWDGRKTMVDDKPYLDQFTKKMFLTEEEQKQIVQAKMKKQMEEKEKLLKEKEEKDKAESLKLLAKKQEQDRLDAEQKRKRDADARKQADARALVLQKQKEDSITRYNELVRIQAEEEAKRKKEKESMETEAQRFKREEEERALAERKNKEIKTNMENELLKLAAENERNAHQKALAIQLEEARANSIIEQMRQEAKLKSDQMKIAQEQKERELELIKNEQDKNSEVKKLIVAAAYADRAVRMAGQKETPEVKTYVRKMIPTVTVSEENGFFKDVRTTVVKYYLLNDTYRKERSFWGTITWYKNNKEIDELVYNVEINFYLSYANK